MKQFGINFLMAVVMTLAFTACDSVIYDDEGDCSVTYRLKFRYDMNMKFADAFPHEVTSVAVYAFDESGTLVWQKSEKGEALAADGYAMTMDLQPGKYQIVAWCGTDNDAAEGESFAVNDMTVGTSTIDSLRCRLNRQHDGDGHAYTGSDLYALFHGTVSVDLPKDDNGGEYTYTLPLTKDTNHLRVILQHLSGEPVDPADFTFTLDDENGYLNYDNSLLDDEQITYRAWNTESGTAGSDDDSSAQTTVNVAIADLTVSRLMADRKMYLTIANKEGETVVHIPFIDYALLVKGYYNRSMGEQEYLDRQDEYSMTFFLDEQNQWVSSAIYINSWRVVVSNPELGNE